MNYLLFLTDLTLNKQRYTQLLSVLVLIIIILVIICGVFYRKHQLKRTHQQYNLQTIGFIQSREVSNHSDEAEQYAIQFMVKTIDANGNLITLPVHASETKKRIEMIKTNAFISLWLNPKDLTKGIYDYDCKGDYIQDALDRLVVKQTDGELNIEKRRQLRKNANSFPAKVMDIQEYNGSTIKIVHVHVTVEYIDHYQSHVCTVSMVLPRYMLQCIHPQDECILVISKDDPSSALVDFKVSCYDPNY